MQDASSRHGRSARRAFALALALSAVLCAPALAVSPASPAVVAVGGEGLQQAPAPPQPGGVCLVDTGVDVDPGTAPILLGRTTVVGGDPGDEAGIVNPPVDGHPDDHGTFMALVAAAPDNGWGTPGLAPTSVRVYSVKVTPAGTLSVSIGDLVNGINECVSLSQSGVPLNTISISLAGGPGKPIPALVQAVDGAESAGLGVVAAAGNQPGQLSWPANVPGVLAVGASDDSDGSICSFSPAPPLAAVIAPGCAGGAGAETGVFVPAPDDGTEMTIGGTSLATPLVAATLAAMRAYDSGLSAAQAQACLLQAGVRLNVAGAFAECGMTLPQPVQPATPSSGGAGSVGQVVIPGFQEPRSAVATHSKPKPKPKKKKKKKTKPKKHKSVAKPSSKGKAKPKPKSKKP
jgi:hypothetical protein